jgi:hypothetical protein
MQASHATTTGDRADPIAGVLAGAVAGAAYLAAQMAFVATVHGGQGWEPLQRISAMLLGEDVLPPPGQVDLTIAGIGLLIHFGLAITFGRLVDQFVRARGVVQGAWRGALVGLALYAVNYWLVAPWAFPWFEENRGLTTALDHLLFGGVAGVAYVHLRAWLQSGSGAMARN